MIRAGIVGGTGYTGLELLRLLNGHDEVVVDTVTSRTEAGRPVHDLFPSLRGHFELVYSEPSMDVLSRCDLVFFATPNATAMESVPDLLSAGVRVIDLSADFRLRSAAMFETWYGVPHRCPELLEEAVYGLPEVNRDRIRSARLVANPGCYPTAVLLGFLPLLERGLVDAGRLIADAKSGVSGAGRKAAVTTAFCEAGDNFKAYAVPGHRHLPEIMQELETVAGKTVGLTFVPHLTPMIRGIHATLYAELLEDAVDLQEVFETRYAGEPFVDVMPPGSHPNTASVRGDNVLRLAWHRPVDGNTVVVLAVEDNLVKGASGQAIQNMNLMFGIEERKGLAGAATCP
ncbi:MAG: N-acetyl-gamma-glutamyl-phosphate reductase [Gammaproteobacteria bacterium]|nr:N-acetyl-gamma-glutamyl-phosphate reductase [Gammaproteobacteria bacterium]